MHVVGLDISLTCTGVAHIGSTAGASATSIKTKSDGETYAARNLRLGDLASRIYQEVNNAALVVIEGPSLGSRTPRVWDRAGLWWRVYAYCRYAGRIPVAVAPPTVLKDWATGSGNADKKLVRNAMNQLWPGVAKNYDESDALALATMGAQKLGMNVPSIPYHKFVIDGDGVEWPAVLKNP